MELQAPRDTGKYCAFFRFVHGENHRFGQKVWCDILVQQEESKGPQMVAQQNLKQSQEERSSLANESEASESKPVQFYDISAKYQEMQRKLEEDPAELERERLKQTVANFMSALDGENPNANAGALDKSSIIQEEDSSSLLDDMIGGEKQVSQVIEEKQPAASQEPLKSSMDQIELQRIEYLEGIQKLGRLEVNLKNNLMYLMEAGFMNLPINHALLLKNRNDLAIVMNLLCNEMMSDSVMNLMK